MAKIGSKENLQLYFQQMLNLPNFVVAIKINDKCIIVNIIY